MKRLIQLVCILGMFGASAYADGISFTTVPSSGLVMGLIGGATGWGYSITNTTGFDLLIVGSAFCGPGGDPFLNSCTSPYDGISNFGPLLGTYNDFISANNTVIGAGITM